MNLTKQKAKATGVDGSAFNIPFVEFYITLVGVIQTYFLSCFVALLPAAQLEFRTFSTKDLTKNIVARQRPYTHTKLCLRDFDFVDDLEHISQRASQTPLKQNNKEKV